MKCFVLTIAISLLGLVPLSIAGVSLDIAPVEEWTLTSSSATFTVDFLGDPGESGLFYVQIQDEDPGVFMDISVEPSVGDMGYIGHVLTSIMPASSSTTYYKTYEIRVEDSEGNLPGGLLAQLTFYQEGYGSSLIKAFKAPDYELSVASVLIAIVDFPGDNNSDPGDFIPVPDGEDIPEPATLLMLGLGGLYCMRRNESI